MEKGLLSHTLSIRIESLVSWGLVHFQGEVFSGLRSKLNHGFLGVDSEGEIPYEVDCLVVMRPLSRLASSVILETGRMVCGVMKISFFLEVWLLDAWPGKVFSTWMAFKGNTCDVGSFREETNEIIDLHQIYEEILFSKRGDENPIRTLGDYFKLRHEGYMNIIELPVGNNVVPLRSDTIRLVQNECSFHELQSEDLNQHLKDFLKLVESLDLDGANRERTRPCLFQFSFFDQASSWLERLPAGAITTWEDLTTQSLSEAWTRFKDLLQKVHHHGIDRWLQIQIFYDHVSFHLKCEIDPAADGKLHNKSTDESWEIIENLALYDNKSWNDPRDFAKLVKAISLPQDVSNTSDRRLIELENQVQCLMEAHFALTQPTQATKSLPRVRSAVVPTTVNIA
ncbi:hypothetical protein Tco_0872253 [Tanacetum coccineum]